MAYYKKVKQKGDNKWHPRAVTIGVPATTDEVARQLAEMSTVSPGDVLAVLGNLGTVLARMMNDGRSVHLQGLGTFYLSCSSEGQGVERREEVSARQITATRVRFIPEYNRAQNRRVVKRTLISPNLFWTDIEGIMTGKDTKKGDGE
ncbi:MAG TPA: HU family DNA-binding protein [Candidatus Bacteroides pullicola]|uniref:HU family DNA-binding protein n=1 Tax=Candidatus Bacteroides pullicola TaxID=2838475 RepID=A0A9D2CLT9_9BACE|nr:HU family DNA-binding protein [Candidatus Bacteroides pullicola]